MQFPRIAFYTPFCTANFIASTGVVSGAHAPLFASFWPFRNERSAGHFGENRADQLLVRGMRMILAKLMKDSVVRGCLLQFLYERRSEGSLPFGQGEQAVPAPGGINRRDWLRAVAQLSEYDLIDWTPVEDHSGMGLLSGFAKINDFGVEVLEGGVAPPIQISIDERRRTTVPKREEAPIATSTPQQERIADALDKVINAINQADLSEQEKNESKSLLRKLLSSKAAAKVLEAVS
jgi:hypothetical protein